MLTLTSCFYWVIVFADLLSYIEEMRVDGKFAHLTAYIDSCYSGSMFYGILPTNIDVFATTAASINEKSFACCYDFLRQTCLGNYYSDLWMEVMITNINSLYNRLLIAVDDSSLNYEIIIFAVCRISRHNCGNSPKSISVCEKWSWFVERKRVRGYKIRNKYSCVTFSGKLIYFRWDILNACHSSLFNHCYGH